MWNYDQEILVILAKKYDVNSGQWPLREVPFLKEISSSKRAELLDTLLLPEKRSSAKTSHECDGVDDSEVSHQREA